MSLSIPLPKKGLSLLLAAALLLTVSGCAPTGGEESTTLSSGSAGVSTPSSEAQPALNTLETAISQAISTPHGGQFLSPGEFYTHGYAILDRVEEGEKTTVCLQIREAYFGMENGIFTPVSSRAFASRMIFTKNTDGLYTLEEREDSREGGEYGESLKELMTPTALEALKNLPTETISAQMGTQAQDYLDSVGREAEVQIDHVEKELPQMENTGVSNTLLDLYAEYPYWIGTLERIEDGVRVLYTHLWEPDGNGGGTATYRREVFGGGVMEEAVIAVTAEGYTVLSGTPRTTRMGQ